jgi:hypothetical protein
MSAYGYLDEALAGLMYGLDSHTNMPSGKAQEVIQFGWPVFGFPGALDLIYGGHIDESLLTLASGLSTSNVFNVQISVAFPAQYQNSGLVLAATTLTSAALSITYAVSAYASMSAMVAAINADTNMIAAGVSASCNAAGTILTILITPNSTYQMGDLTVTSSITGGSVPAITTTYTTQMRFLGVAVFEQRAHRIFGAGSEEYLQYEPLGYVQMGKLYVPVANSVTGKNVAYPIIGGTNKNSFTDSSSPSGGYVYSPFSSSPLSGVQPVFQDSAVTVAGSLLAKLMVRGPY